MDKAAHQVKIDGQEIELSYKEFELLSIFYGESGHRSFQRENSEQCMEL